MDKQLPAVKEFHAFVRRSQHRAKTASVRQGILDNLDIVWRKLKKIRDLGDPDAHKKIGIFGPQKRGKSTLINVLVGLPILPTAPVPMTKTVVEVCHEPNLLGWKVYVHDDNGFIDLHHSEDPSHVAELVEKFGTHRGKERGIEKIRIHGPFPGCQVLGRGGILVDTPGAELAFTCEGEAVEVDTARALRILDDVHAVLFCVRADQLGSDSEYQFYQKRMRTLGTLNVINFKDLWEEDDNELYREAVRKYHFPRDRTVVVSGRMAEQAPADPAVREKSGIASLENRILDEIRNLTPEDGLLACVQEYVNIVTTMEHGNPQDILPERIYLDNCKAAVVLDDTIGKEIQRFLEEIGKS